MTSSSRTEAQGRADEVRAFEAELERLQQEGVLALSQEQRAAVKTHHADLLAQLAQSFDIDPDARARQLSLGMRVASFLGALALAASVFFLFWQFWGLLPTAAQVATLVGAALATFGATAWLAQRDASGYFARLAAMVAFACFVLDLAMLGQIFNITPSDQALLPWAALALLLAYLCEARLLLACGILCLVAWIGARTGTWAGGYWLYFGERPENFLPAAAVLFVVPSLFDQRRYAGFEATWHVFGLLALFLPMLVLANWGRASYLDSGANVVEGFYQTLGFVLGAACVALGIWRRWPHVVNTGVTFFVIFLFTKFFDWWWDVMPKYLFFLVLGLTAMLFLFVLQRVRRAGLLGAHP